MNFKAQKSLNLTEKSMKCTLQKIYELSGPKIYTLPAGIWGQGFAKHELPEKIYTWTHYLGMTLR